MRLSSQVGKSGRQVYVIWEGVDEVGKLAYESGSELLGEESRTYRGAWVARFTDGRVKAWASIVDAKLWLKSHSLGGVQ